MSEFSQHIGKKAFSSLEIDTPIVFCVERRRKGPTAASRRCPLARTRPGLASVTMRLSRTKGILQATWPNRPLHHIQYGEIACNDPVIFR
jgi:hypothetical protein